MKTQWYWQRWLPIKPLNGKYIFGVHKFCYWSPMLAVSSSKKPITDVSGAGFSKWLMKNLLSREVAIFQPTGKPETAFLMGFYDEQNRTCLIAPFKYGVREVCDGPFAMRVSNRPLKYFIVGEAKVGLSVIETLDRDSPIAKREGGHGYGDLIVY